MTTPPLKLARHETFQRREWIIQRMGWCVWASVLIAAALGLLGASGPLSHAHGVSPDGALSIEYDRFVHRHHLTVLKALAEPSGATLELTLSQSLVNAIEIHRIQPEPGETRVTDTGITMVFPTEAQKSAAILMHFEQEGIGTVRGEIGIAGEKPIPVKQFVYP